MQYGRIKRGIVEYLDLTEEKMEIVIPREMTREIPITAFNINLYLDQIDEARRIEEENRGITLPEDWAPESITETYIENDYYTVLNPTEEQILEQGWFPVEEIEGIEKDSEVIDGVLKVYLGIIERPVVTTDSQEYCDLVESKIRERYSMSEELALIRQRDTKVGEFQEYFNYCENCKEQAKQFYGIDIVNGEDD